MWRIVNWDKNFENHRSREVKDLQWVAMPNSHDGGGYTELLDHKNGAAHFGAWCAIVQVASKSHPRGELRRGGKQAFHDFASLARMTRISGSVLQEAIPRLLDIGWLELIPEADANQQLRGGPRDAAAQSRNPVLNGKKGMEGNGIEGKGKNEAAAPGESVGEPTLTEMISEIYSRYLHHHPRAAKTLSPDHKEFKLIRARIREGSSVQDLRDAIDGNHISPFHCGENNEKAEYHALTVIFRDQSQVTKFIEFARGDVKTKPKDPRGNIASGNEYLAMFPPEPPPVEEQP